MVETFPATNHHKDLVLVGDRLFSLLLSAESLDAADKRVASQIRHGLPGTRVVLVSVDEGGATFTDTLQTHLTQAGIEVVRGSLKLRSMHGTRSSERIQLDRELDVPVAGEYVCVCDDIDDRRFTQRFLRGYFDGMGALSVKYAMNLSKRGVPDRLLDIPDPDYVGLYIDNLFVVGRNLDYNEEGRELSDLYAEISERSLLEELAEMYDLQDRLLHLQTAAA